MACTHRIASVRPDESTASTLRLINQVRWQPSLGTKWLLTLLTLSTWHHLTRTPAPQLQTYADPSQAGPAIPRRLSPKEAIKLYLKIEEATPADARNHLLPMQNWLRVASTDSVDDPTKSAVEMDFHYESPTRQGPTMRYHYCNQPSWHRCQPSTTGPTSTSTTCLGSHSCSQQLHPIVHGA